MARKRKKKNPPVREVATAESVSAGKKKTKKIVIIAVSALVGLAILLGAVLGIILGIRSASYAVYMNGVGVSEGAANYLAAYFKTDYQAILANELKGTGIEVSDTEQFWNKKIHPDVATTYGDYLSIYVEDSVRSLVTANVIFDSTLKLDYEDKAEIAVATEAILNYHADGDVRTFNADCEKYGFDYDDFVEATELLYKGGMLRNKLFGKSGEKMSLYPEECESFFEDYKRVKLLFIRTDKMVSYNNGVPEFNEDGTYKLIDIDPASGEYAERMEDIEKLNGIINGTYDFALFDDMWKKYEKENNKELYGCYLRSGSSFTSTLRKKYTKVVSEALLLSDGEMIKIDDNDSNDENSFIGTVFVYCDGKEPGAYSKSDEYGYFSDFNYLAATYVTEKMIADKENEVEFREKWESIDIVHLPYLLTYVAKF